MGIYAVAPCMGFRMLTYENLDWPEFDSACLSSGSSHSEVGFKECSGWLRVYVCVFILCSHRLFYFDLLYTKGVENVSNYVEELKTTYSLSTIRQLILLLSQTFQFEPGKKKAKVQLSRKWKKEASHFTNRIQCLINLVLCK